jgi:site-specific recombinase XerD
MADDPLNLLPLISVKTLPVFNEVPPAPVPSIGETIAKAHQAWLMKSPSRDTRSNYDRDIRQFLEFAGITRDQPEKLATVESAQVSAWRDHLLSKKLTNSSVRRKMTALRSLFS